MRFQFCFGKFLLLVVLVNDILEKVLLAHVVLQTTIFHCFRCVESIYKRSFGLTISEASANSLFIILRIPSDIKYDNSRGP